MIASGGRTKVPGLRGVLKGGMCDVIITDEQTATSILAMEADMTTDVVLGIDIGTSGVRIAATDEANTLKAMSAAPIVAPITDFGRAWQDPQLWWNATLAAFAALKLDGLHVRAIAIDGTSGTILAVDADGSPASLASMYNDVCEARTWRTIAAVAPRETAALGSTSPLARAMELAGQGSRIIHQADWILGKLSGRYDVTDENNALKSGYDPVTRYWPALDRQDRLRHARSSPPSFPPAPRSATSPPRWPPSSACPQTPPSSPAPPTAAPPSSRAARPNRATASPRSAPR